MKNRLQVPGNKTPTWDPYKAAVEKGHSGRLLLEEGKKLKIPPLISLRQPTMKQRKGSHTHGEVAAEMQENVRYLHRST
jgi:hypothetical protein